MDQKRHASSRRCVVVEGHGSDRVLDVLSSLGTQSFGWMGMYVWFSSLSSCDRLLNIRIQGIWEPNDEYADGDYVG